MASLIVRNIDDALKEKLRLRAARHGRSMEEEARTILKDALATDEPLQTGLDFLNAMRARLAPYGYLDIELPPREMDDRDPPTFD